MQASGETILRRTAMMARGTCNAAEYQRMVTEKMHASRRAGLALMRGQGPHAVLAPYLRAATANARRLRGK
ncbi:hypothetical protein [Rhodopila sp.]|uniref:hypothetical protein n=1 Tax=Rhodopila sp. TaxID=2480087 RepID=UPI002D810863|nr:hypothetical protein [Rhodopila sp.]